MYITIIFIYQVSEKRGPNMLNETNRHVFDGVSGCVGAASRMENKTRWTKQKADRTDESKSDVLSKGLYVIYN